MHTVLSPGSTRSCKHQLKVPPRLHPNCCPNCHAEQSHKDNVRSSAVGKQLKQKKSNSLAQLHLPALGLFWASFFVRIQLTSLFLISPGLWVGEAEFQLDNFRTVLKKSLYMCLASSLVVRIFFKTLHAQYASCLLYTSPSPRDFG